MVVVFLIAAVGCSPQDALDFFRRQGFAVVPCPNVRDLESFVDTLTREYHTDQVVPCCSLDFVAKIKDRRPYFVTVFLDGPPLEVPSRSH